MLHNIDYSRKTRRCRYLSPNKERMSSFNVYVIILLSIVSFSIGNVDNQSNEINSRTSRAGPSESGKEFHIQPGNETKRQPLWAEDDTKAAELLEKVQHYRPRPQKNEIDNIMEAEELYAVTTVNMKKQTEKPKATSLAPSISMNINTPVTEIDEIPKKDAKRLSWAEQEEYKSAEEIFEDPNPHNTSSNKAHTTLKPTNNSSTAPMFHNFTQTTASLPNSLIESNALQVTPKTNFMETIENPFVVPFWNDRKKYVRDQKIQHRMKRSVERVDLDDASKSSSETGGISEEYLLFEEDRSHLMKRSLKDYVSGDLIVRGEIKTTPVVMSSSYNTLKKTINDDLVLKLETFLNKNKDGTFSKFTFLILNISSDSNYNTVPFEVHLTDSDTFYGAQDDSQIRRDLAEVLLSIHQVGTYYINISLIEDMSNKMVPSICILCESYETCINVTSNNWECSLAEQRTYPYGILHMDNHLSRNNEFATQKLYIEDYIPFQQTLHNEIWISVNGIISFGEEFASFSPQRLPVMDSSNKTYRHLLAPYWTDLDLVEGDEGNVFYHMYDCKKSDICIRANDDVHKYANISLYNATTVIVITWVKVPAHGNSNERVSFQCAIISNSYTTYAIYFYMQGAMQLKPASARNVEAGWGSINLDSSKSAYYVFDTVMGNTGKITIF
ncbi:uncharacterized protein LOC131935655 [Physella acuta]|uniref:uncharacterized protein LOC131935655 n=1 Tax=Physella acuta TaxID=109671 RepID=UPI0027DEA3D6|nr:uncharacterized protein LOC131935655 [Physella acuta]